MKKILFLMISATLIGCQTKTVSTPVPVQAPPVIADQGPLVPVVSVTYPDLSKGDKGDAVIALQKALGITADGDFGPGTEAAVKKFQADHNLIISEPGTVGPKTWAALSVSVNPVIIPSEPVTTPISIPAGQSPILGWDIDPSRKTWSLLIYGLARGELKSKFDQATDGTRLCAKWSAITDDQRAQVIAEFIVQIAKNESGWSPVSRYFEKTMGYYSEGLLQLSYPDKEWAKYCKFDQAADAKYSATDPRRTILDPLINLDCGERILADQVVARKKFIVDQGVYWAVIKDNGKYQQIASITGKTKALPFCK